MSVVTPPGTAAVPTVPERPLAATRRGTLVERLRNWAALQALRVMLRVVRWLIGLRGRA